MSRRLAVSIIALVVVLVGGWAMAVQEPAPNAAPSLPSDPQFVVVAGGDATVLLKAKSGRTWSLFKSADGTSAWLAITKRLNTDLENKIYLTNEKEFIAPKAREKAIHDK
ncbi:MAG: hypothetical protein ACYC4U_26610 [Pirellulaceae bacterium]